MLSYLDHVITCMHDDHMMQVRNAVALAGVASC